MQIALDAGPLLDPPTGVGRYTGELLSALRRSRVEVQPYAVAWGGEAPEGVQRLKLPARVARSLWRTFGGPGVDRLVGDARLIHATNFVLPPLGGRAGVVTVHDLSFLHAGAFPGAERLRDLVPWSVERAHQIVTPTAAVAIEVAEEYSLDRARISVTHLGVSPVFFGATPLSDVALAGMGISRPFVLATGTEAPRKNLQALLDAWVAAREDLRGWTLVLAGPRGWGPRFGRTEDIHPLGWVGDETLPGLMAAAEVFCYPSLYEGFGMPPLEAMAAGTACIAGAYSAAPEVLGDAAVLVDPNDTSALSSALVRIVGDEEQRRSLARRGRAHATGFTWERTAAATMRAYEAAAERAGVDPALA